MAAHDPYASSDPTKSATPPHQRESPPPAGERTHMQSGSTTGDAGSAVRQGADNLSREAQERLAPVADRVRRQTTHRLSQQLHQTAEGTERIAGTVRQVSDELRRQQQERIAEWTELAAEQLERLSRYMRDKDVSDLVTDAERFARRQPTLFLGGAFALGLLAARFFKSSGESMQEGYPTNGGRSPYGAHESSRSQPEHGTGVERFGRYTPQEVADQPPTYGA